MAYLVDVKTGLAFNANHMPGGVDIALNTVLLAFFAQRGFCFVVITWNACDTLCLLRAERTPLRTVYARIVFEYIRAFTLKAYL